MQYNKGAKELEELRPGDTVRLQPQKSKFGKKTDWTQARVEGKVDIRSYQVRTEDGRVYRRNRRHPRRTREVTLRGRDEIGPHPREEPTTATANASGELLSVPPATRSTAVSKVQPETTPVQETNKPQVDYPVQTTQQSLSKEEASPPMTTRSGRIVRPPNRYR